MLISKFIYDEVENEILDLEKKIKVKLPGEYREFLKKYNGGYTPKTTFKINKVSSDIRGFYGVGDAKLCFDTINLLEWVQKQMIPIACDSFGNYIVINYESKLEGYIYFYNHEKEGELTMLKETLKEFIKCCKSEEISEASKRSIKEREELLIAKGKGSIINDALRAMWQTEIDKYSNMIQEEVILN